jgi:hypothetical protein
MAWVGCGVRDVGRMAGRAPGRYGKVPQQHNHAVAVLVGEEGRGCRGNYLTFAAEGTKAAVMHCLESRVEQDGWRAVERMRGRVMVDTSGSRAGVC